MVSSETSLYCRAKVINQQLIGTFIILSIKLLTKEFPLIPPYVQHPVPDECTLMGVVTEKTQQYMVPTVPHFEMVKNENEYVGMYFQDQN